MDSSAIARCQELIGYRFSDPSLLSQALTHASVAPTRLASNERLEFLGDAVLGLVVCQELYEQQAELQEGEMTKIKSVVVSRRTCACVADETGIGQLLRLGKGMNRADDDVPTSVLAAVFESIIGAIYLDGGLAAAAAFILRHLRSYIAETFADQHGRNYKAMLQQHLQQAWSTTPDYKLLDEKGPDHSKCFEVAVSAGGRFFPSAWGRNKKEAEQKAAREALRDMGLLDGPADDEADLEEP